jgi:hypothetical protein
MSYDIKMSGEQDQDAFARKLVYILSEKAPTVVHLSSLWALFSCDF